MTWRSAGSGRAWTLSTHLAETTLRRPAGSSMSCLRPPSLRPCGCVPMYWTALARGGVCWCTEHDGMLVALGMAAHLTLESIQFNGNAVPPFAQGPGPGPGYSAGGYSGRVPSMPSNAGPAPAEYEGYGQNAHGEDHAGGRHDKAPMGNVAPQGRGKQAGQTPPRGYGRAPLHPGKQVSGVTDGVARERVSFWARLRFAETSCLPLTRHCLPCTAAAPGAIQGGSDAGVHARPSARRGPRPRGMADARDGAVWIHAPAVRHACRRPAALPPRRVPRGHGGCRCRIRTAYVDLSILCMPPALTPPDVRNARVGWSPSARTCEG
jgi:hypothetical protein